MGGSKIRLFAPHWSQLEKFSPVSSDAGTESIHLEIAVLTGNSNKRLTVEAHILKSKRLNVLGFVSWVTSKAQNAQWVNKTLQKERYVKHDASSLNKQKTFCQQMRNVTSLFKLLFCASESFITELCKRREQGSPTGEAAEHLLCPGFPWSGHTITLYLLSAKETNLFHVAVRQEITNMTEVNCYLPGVSKRAEHWNSHLCANSLLGRDVSSWKWGRRARSEQNKGTPAPSYAKPWL